jgi:predicted ATP-binding protein involved in virulence
LNLFDYLPYKTIEFIYNNNDKVSFVKDNNDLIEFCDEDDLAKLSGKVHYLSDQRIFDLANLKLIHEKISYLPSQLLEIIEKAATKYSEESNKLDGSYRKRLLESTSGIDEQEYNSLSADLESKFEKLIKYNLVVFGDIDTVKYDKKYENALKIYFDDFNKKYSIFSDLITKLELFTNIINNRFLFKNVVISPNEGFFIESENGEGLFLEDLSTGEKQEIILFYELIFNTEKDTLLLIDEPETSLHVAWQLHFIADLIKIAKVNGFKAIVTTHSPHIINNHRNIQIDLGSLYNAKQSS